MTVEHPPDEPAQPRPSWIPLADKILSDWRRTCRLIVLLAVIAALAVLTLLLLELDLTIGPVHIAG
ncbi:hypothetical protein [Actinophytocola sp.]|jgi:hypothetical protein|uniref:hypothetical protein n=1 Tax=Actinophytocola sp. TaxID=1872138 RepID=UPI002ED92549